MSGKPLSAAELCQHCPEMIPEVEIEIRRLKDLEEFMFPRSFRSTVAASATDPPPDLDETQLPVEGTIFPTLPGYLFLKEIGRGGMGVVYKALQLSVNRTVAIKMLAGSRWAQPGYVTRLRQEANSLAQLDDHRIVKVFDVLETENSVSLVLEYVEGEDLSFRLRGRPIPVNEAARIACEVARTLTVVHRRQLLHRDIKPGNVMIGNRGEIKITDFGVAKDLTSSVSPTEMGDLIGTPSYMAPEQTMGKSASIDQRTDIYAVGATLYEMLTGHPPFVGTSTMDTLSLVQKGNPRPPRQLNPAVPEDLQTICLKCLELDPDRRFDTAKELADELERFQTGQPILSRPISSFERFVRTCKRNPTITTLATLATVATIAMLSMIVVNDATQRRNLLKFNEQLTRLNTGLRETAAHAKQLQQVAEEHERAANNRLYAADINRAVLAWRQEDTREMTQVLDRHIPKPGRTDHRGFIWWFLHRQSEVAKTVLLETGNPQYLLCHSPDGLSMVTAGAGAIVRFFDPQTGQVQKQIPTDQMEINGIAFSPTRNEMATSGDDGTIRIWNLQTGTDRLSFKTPYRKVYQIVYLPDGKRIVGCGNHSTVHVFDALDGQTLASLEGHTKSIDSLALGEDGNTLATIANDQTIRIWDLNDNRQLAAIESPGNVETFLFEQKRGLLITGSGQGYLRTVSLREHREIAAIRNLDRMGSLALHPDGSTLAVGDASGKIRLRRIGPTGEFIDDSFQPWQAHDGMVNGLLWSKNGDRLISTGRDGKIVSSNSVATQRISPTRIRLNRGPDDTPVPEDSWLILMDKVDESKNRWDPQTGSPPFRTISKQHQGACISPDGKYAAAIKDSQTLELFAVPDDPRKPLDERLLASWKSDGILDINLFAADSQSLFVLNMHEATEKEPPSSQILVFQVPDLKLTERTHDSVEKAVEISPDGQRLAMIASNDLKVSDLSGQQTYWRVSQPGARIVAFSPDGNLIATSIADRTIVIRDAHTGDLLFTLTNHRSLVRQMIFALDSSTLVTSTESGSVVFTHAVTGQELVEFPDIGDVQRLLFLEDGRYLICQVRRKSMKIVDEAVIFDGGISNTAAQSCDSKLR